MPGSLQKILMMLTEKCSHCSKVRSIQGLVGAVEKIKSRLISEELGCCVDMLLDRLRAQESKPLQDLQNSLERLGTGDVRHGGPPLAGGRFKKPGMNFISGGLAHRSKSITFQFPRGCLTQDSQSQMESDLLRIKGILSIYFDLCKSRCIVRTKLEVNPETVGCALVQGAQMSVDQVTKDDCGRETLVSIGNEMRDNLDKENDVEGPDYLNESFGDSPNKDLDHSRALARSGHKANSQHSSTGFWGNVTSFLTNSFYW